MVSKTILFYFYGEGGKWRSGASEEIIFTEAEGAVQKLQADS